MLFHGKGSGALLNHLYLRVQGINPETLIASGNIKLLTLQVYSDLYF